MSGDEESKRSSLRSSLMSERLGVTRPGTASRKTSLQSLPATQEEVAAVTVQAQWLASAEERGPARNGGNEDGSGAGNHVRAHAGQPSSQRSSQRRTSLLGGLADFGQKQQSKHRDNPSVTMQIHYNGPGGVPCVLEVRLRKREAIKWVDGLRMLLKVLPRFCAPGYWRLALACMQSTSKRGASGFLHTDELRSFLRRANASPDISSQTLQEAIASVRESDSQLDVPAWVRATALNFCETEKLLAAQQVTGLLLRLCTSSPALQEVFHRYAPSGQMDLTAWLSFVRQEQLPISGDKTLFEARHRGICGERDEENLALATRRFETATKSAGGELRVESGTLNFLQFTLQILNSENDAVALARPEGMTDDLHEPLSHYWNACSHNSYIFGDQLTGISTADAYRRQLLQARAGCFSFFFLPMMLRITRFQLTRAPHLLATGLPSPRD